MDIKKANLLTELENAVKQMTYSNIKGKPYAEVKERVKAFRRCWPDGSIMTELVSDDGDRCVFKANVYGIAENGEPIVLASGYASETRTSSNVNKTSYLENCVPLDAQILTDRGWKYYFQLRPLDRVLSLNLQTRKIELCTLNGINVYKDMPVVQMVSSRFNAICTPEHKWVTDYQNSNKLERVKTRELKVHHRIVQNEPQEYITSDAGRRLGWLMCDCEIARTKEGLPSTAYIHQSKYVEDVEELFGEGRLCKKYDDDWKDSYEWVIPANEVREILGRFRINDYSDLAEAMLTADIEDVAGCFKSMMLADGSKRGFSSTYLELVEAVQIMCVRLGIPTTFITSRMCKLSTRPIYTLGIKKSHRTYFSEIRILNLPPRDVWCPTTENGTWFMRQGSFVTLTSNCETSAVGRALGFAGFGIDAAIASADEVDHALEAQDALKKAELEEQTLSPVEAAAFEAHLTAEGVNIEKMLASLKIKSLDEMKLKTYRNIFDNMAKAKEAWT